MEHGTLTQKKIEEFANGPNNMERRNVSTDSSNRKDNGRNSVDK